MMAYVVESPVRTASGALVPGGTYRVYVATEERAQFLVSQGAERTYRPIPLDELPARARENLQRAATKGG